MTVYPFGYGTATRTLEQIRTWLLVHHHPEYVRRFCAWLQSKGGEIGAGGGWRADGSQPDLPGFAPEGRSFHQNQKYEDGFIGACAVDVVRRNPAGGNHLSVRWTDVPVQGTAEAARWGVHANVGTPGTAGSEAWHIQPVEIDGWVSWEAADNPAPQLGYPLPGDEEDMGTPAENAHAVWEDTDRLDPITNDVASMWEICVRARVDANNAIREAAKAVSLCNQILAKVNAISTGGVVDVAAIARAVADEDHRRSAS